MPYIVGSGRSQYQPPSYKLGYWFPGFSFVDFLFHSQQHEAISCDAVHDLISMPCQMSRGMQGAASTVSKGARFLQFLFWCQVWPLLVGIEPGTFVGRFVGPNPV